MSSRSLIEARLNNPRTQQAFRGMKVLVSCYLAISILTLVAIVLLRGNDAIAPVAVWVRGIIVVAHAFVTLLFVVRATRGSRVGLILLRIGSAVMVVAIAVIIVIPGDFPLWFKVEQAICGLLLLGIVTVVFGKQLRSTFASK
ncbi:MAG TPA: hypothetical protein VF099_14305 [Ktedonobacterales bacterium]